MTGTVAKLAPLAVFVFGGSLVIAGRTDLGTLVAFLSGFDRLAEPVRALVAYYREAFLAQTRYRMIADWIGGSTSPS